METQRLLGQQYPPHGTVYQSPHFQAPPPYSAGPPQSTPYYGAPYQPYQQHHQQQGAPYQPYQHQQQQERLLSVGNVRIDPVMDASAPAGHRFPDAYPHQLQGRMTREEFVSVIEEVNMIMWSGADPIVKRQKRRNLCMCGWLCFILVGIAVGMGVPFATMRTTLTDYTNPTGTTTFLIVLLVPMCVVLFVGGAGIMISCYCFNKGTVEAVQATHRSVERYVEDLNARTTKQGVAWSYKLEYQTMMAMHHSSNGAMHPVQTTTERPHLEIALFMPEAAMVPPAAPAAERRDETVFVYDVVLGQRLGGGHFGEVFAGRWQGTTDVALKRRKAAAGEEFHEEARLLRTLRHPNVLMFLGLHKDVAGTEYIVTELMPDGSVLDVLQRRDARVASLPMRLMLVQDAAKGMAFLHENNIVHRDLAARNLLLRFEAGRLTAKVGDLGMSRLLKQGVFQAASGEVIDFHRAAPEVFRLGRFSKKSDVYALGLLLWEVVEWGTQPFQGLDMPTMRARVESGDRPKVSSDTPPAVSTLMAECWDAEAEERVSCRQLFNRIETILAPPAAAAPADPLNDALPPYATPASLIPPPGRSDEVVMETIQTPPAYTIMTPAPASAGPPQ